MFDIPSKRICILPEGEFGAQRRKEAAKRINMSLSGDVCANQADEFVDFLVMLLCETIESRGILWYNISVT